MAEAQVRLLPPGKGRPALDGRGAGMDSARNAGRWNDYGIGLLEQAQYGAAALAFGRESELAPANPDAFVNAAIAEMNTERFSPERYQLRKAAHLLDCALAIDPKHARARYFQALVLRGEGKTQEAAERLRELALDYPRDREIQRQLGQTFYTPGRIEAAQSAFETVLAIDPTDAGAYQFLAPIYESKGRKAEADRARALYLEWRDDPLADSVAARFYAAHPQWAEERIKFHTHNADSPRRKILTGPMAAPER